MFLELNPSFSPKWNILTEILQHEIPLDLNKPENTDKKAKILILCQDRKTCFQLNQYLSQGPKKYLFLMALKKEVKFKKVSTKFIKNVRSDMIKAFNETKINEPTNKPKKSKKDNDATDLETLLEEKLFADVEEDFEDIKDCFMLSMTQGYDKTKKLNDEDIEDESDDGFIFEPFAEMENMDLTNVEEKNEPIILLQTFKTDGNVLSLPKTLLDFQPNYIIMYHSNVTAIRQIEIFEARRRKQPQLKVYFLIHAETVEEQSYLTDLRREKQAFEHLIERKSTMVIPDYQDGKTDECAALHRGLVSPVKNTRQGGVQNEEQEKRLIIVDMREFRSDLPALIHRRGIEIEPVTITVSNNYFTGRRSS